MEPALSPELNSIENLKFQKNVVPCIIQELTGGIKLELMLRFTSYGDIVVYLQLGFCFI